MSATMARQGDRVQLGQSDMGLALNVAKMAKQRSSHAAIEEAQYLMKNLSLRTEMRRSGVLSFWGIKR